MASGRRGKLLAFMDVTQDPAHWIQVQIGPVVAFIVKVEVRGCRYNNLHIIVLS